MSFIILLLIKDILSQNCALYTTQSSCPTTGATTCGASNNYCFWNSTLGKCLDNGCGHNSDCMYTSSVSCVKPGCSWNSLGYCSYVGGCEQYTSNTTCPTDNSNACGTSNCSWNSTLGVCFDNGCSHSTNCIATSSSACTSHTNCAWNTNEFCHYSGSSTPASCLQISSSCTACATTQNLCHLKNPHCYFGSRTCFNASTSPTCNSGSECSSCLSAYDCTNRGPSCHWNMVSHTCSASTECAEFCSACLSKSNCEARGPICSWESGTERCSTCNTSFGCSACGNVVDCAMHGGCAWDESRISCYRDGIVASHLKATLTVLSSTVVPNGTVFDMTTTDPDQFVEITINGQAYTTNHCTDSLTCNYNQTTPFVWNNIPLNDLGYVRLYDWDSPTARKLIMVDNITTLDWISSFTLTLLSGNLSGTYVLMNMLAEGQCDEDFYVSNVELTKCTLQECNLRSPVNGTCFAGDHSDTRMCYIQPKGAPRPCASTCPVFYNTSGDQCIPQACIARTPVGNKCRSLDDTTPEKMNCGYFLDSPTCVFCPESHYQGDAQGVCTLKTCTARSVNASVTFTCGESNCNEQADGRCAPGCPSAHTEVDERGRCTLKTCALRQANASETFTCGEKDCNEQPNGSCAEGCIDPYTVGNKGKCVVDPCESRHVNPKSTFPCETPSCFQQISNYGTASSNLSDSCAPTCDPATRYIPNTETGTCVLLSCELRNAEKSLPLPCGTTDCFQQMNNGGTGNGVLSSRCGPSCDPALYTANIADGTCKLLECEARTSLPSAAYPCGTTDCFEQLNQGGTESGVLGSTCSTSCDPTLGSADIKTGTCVYVDCGMRTPDTTGSLTYPCGTENCFQQMVKDELGVAHYTSVCNTSCNPELFKMADGKCVLLSCDVRIPDASLENPCGTADCFPQPNGSCSENLCQYITECVKELGCKTNTNNTITSSCVPDPCFEHTQATECLISKKGCVWIDNHCESSDECANSQTDIVDGPVCRDGCFLNVMESTTTCVVDPCAVNTVKNTCESRSNPMLGYECKWNEDLRNCRANDICKTDFGCAENCRVNPDGICMPNICSMLSGEDTCNSLITGMCTFLGESCVWNDCQVSKSGIKTYTCLKGCEMNDAVGQCVPDSCVRQHWPAMKCESSNTCVIVDTVPFGSACVYDPSAGKGGKNGKKFPWWLLLIGLLVVVAVSIAIGAAAIFLWKKKKNEKTRVKVEDVGVAELQRRDSDAREGSEGSMSRKSEASSNNWLNSLDSSTQLGEEPSVEYSMHSFRSSHGKKIKKTQNNSPRNSRSSKKSNSKTSRSSEKSSSKTSRSSERSSPRSFRSSERSNLKKTKVHKSHSKKSIHSSKRSSSSTKRSNNNKSSKKGMNGSRSSTK